MKGFILGSYGKAHSGQTELSSYNATGHDRYQRTGDGWKFTEGVYEIRSIDHTPLAGPAPGH
jgi:hypothetical protein